MMFLILNYGNSFDIVHLFYSQHYEKIAAIITSNFISL